MKWDLQGSHCKKKIQRLAKKKKSPVPVALEVWLCGRESRFLTEPRLRGSCRASPPVGPGQAGGQAVPTVLSNEHGSQHRFCSLLRNQSPVLEAISGWAPFVPKSIKAPWAWGFLRGRTELKSSVKQAKQLPLQLHQPRLAGRAHPPRKLWASQPCLSLPGVAPTPSNLSICS